VREEAAGRHRSLDRQADDVDHWAAGHTHLGDDRTITAVERCVLSHRRQ
jgi:hypothetical protein